MACFFLIDVFIDEDKGRGLYSEYIEAVQSIVESFGGEYLARSEKFTGLHLDRRPGRVIIIRFPDRASLDACFSSPAYLDIMHKRSDYVDARAVIVEG